MKLFVAAICLLCCASAGAQTKKETIYLGEHLQIQNYPCVNELAYWYAGAFAEAPPFRVCGDALSALSRVQAANKKQLICDWAKDHWNCPTDKPISSAKGDLFPLGSTLFLGSGTVEGPPEKNLAVYPPYMHIDCDHVLGGCGGYKAPPPFDVPAIPPVIEHSILISDWTCADKSRFLLKSEDGKSHCLKLVP